MGLNALSFLKLQFRFNAKTVPKTTLLVESFFTSLFDVSMFICKIENNNLELLIILNWEVITKFQMFSLGQKY